MIGEIEGAPATRILEDGDVVDTGDRAFEVLHLPGHSPGSIGLWEASTGILFSGDAVYDGPLLDELEGSNIDDYVKTMERLRDLPVTVVHGGHEASFDRDRLVEICDDYLASREIGESPRDVRLDRVEAVEDETLSGPRLGLVPLPDDVCPRRFGKGFGGAVCEP